MLAALPAVVAAVPVPGSGISPAALRGKILASAALPYQGYAESTADLGLPSLPYLQDVSRLLDGTIDQYAWYRSPGHWRADELTTAGENDVYQVGRMTYLWSFAYRLLSRVTGSQPVRLPRAADLLPPPLGRRLLGLATAADHLSRLPSLRVAGVDAAGLRLVPAGAATTIGAIEIWADPATGLPVEVRVIGRGARQAALTTSFLQLSQRRPALAAVLPHPAPGTDIATARLPALRGILNGDGDGDHDDTPFPAQLAGLSRTTAQAGLYGLATYGAGLLPARPGAAAGAGGPAGSQRRDPGRCPRGHAGRRLRDTGPHSAADGPAGHLPVPKPDFPAHRRGEPGPAGERGHWCAGPVHQRAAMIVTRSLSKRFGKVLAVDQIDLDVREGDRYGFLGPNGSGKTTVIRLLLGLVYATSGTIEIMGKPMPARAAELLPAIGSLVEGPSSYGHLSGRANLSLLDASGRAGSRRTRRRRIGDALEQVGLAGIDNRAVKKYSLGMRQRLGLAAAMLRAPRLLILDEPGNGLDPQGIVEMRDLLAGLNRAGTTIFLSSHQLAEVDLLCSRVGIVDRGRLVLQEDLDVLRAPTGRVIVRSPDADRAAAALDGSVERRDGDQLIVAADPAELNARLVGAGVRVTEIGPERRSLEDLMLAVTSSGSDRVDLAGRRGGQAGPGRGGRDVSPAEGGGPK